MVVGSGLTVLPIARREIGEQIPVSSSLMLLLDALLLISRAAADLSKFLQKFETKRHEHEEQPCDLF